ncbi:MAG: hypothetical protein ACU0BF_04730 [Paracoccaceae bacterium]
MSQAKSIKFAALALAAGAISACSPGQGLRPYQGPGDFIAIASDQGFDSDPLENNNAGVAVTPDGCQAWMIDDGVDGRASNRLDPVSGLPVCFGQPGVVYGPYQSGSQGIPDFVPGRPAPRAAATATQVGPDQFVLSSR